MTDDNSHEDIARWKSLVFSPLAISLIGDIMQLGGEAELVRKLDMFRKEFEPSLQQLRDRLMASAMDRGLEI